jgi:hypothetical protein
MAINTAARHLTLMSSLERSFVSAFPSQGGAGHFAIMDGRPCRGGATGSMIASRPWEK